MRTKLVLVVAALSMFAGLSVADTPNKVAPVLKNKAPGFYAVAREASIQPGTTVLVDVFAWKVNDLRGFELHPQVKGGTTGSVTLTSITADAARPDYVFAGAGQTVSAQDEAKGRYVATLMQGGVNVPEQAYMATFEMQVSPDASGSFTVGFKAINDKTVARDSASQPIVLPKQNVTTQLTVATPRVRPRERNRSN
jgi:hypothetical protein